METHSSPPAAPCELPPRRIVALVESGEHVCCRYRVAAFGPALSAAGHELEIRALPRTLLARLRLYRQMRDVDVVIVQRRLLPLAELAVLRRAARRLVFDFDDALWLRDSYTPKGLASRKRSRRFRATIRAADRVIAGNAYLAREAHRYAGEERVAVIPTCVDPGLYPVANHTSRVGPPRLVWVGSASTLQGLERFRPTLEAIGRAIPGIRLTVVCDRFPAFEYLAVDEVPWSSAGEASSIAAADVGIGWVPDDPWSRGKCGLKVLQYQAAGLPVVANAVGVQADLVRHAETGFLAESAEEWVGAIRALADPSLRQRFGGAGRRQVEERYCVAVGGRLWLESLYFLCDEIGARRTG